MDKRGRNDHRTYLNLKHNYLRKQDLFLKWYVAREGAVDLSVMVFLLRFPLLK